MANLPSSSDQFDPEKHERPPTPLSATTTSSSHRPTDRLSRNNTNTSRISRTISVTEVRDGIPYQRDIEVGDSSQDEKDGPDAPPRDPNLVGWEGPDDPKFPKNWSINKKWAAVACGKLDVCLTTSIY